MLEHANEGKTRRGKTWRGRGGGTGERRMREEGWEAEGRGKGRSRRATCGGGLLL